MSEKLDLSRERYLRIADIFKEYGERMILEARREVQNSASLQSGGEFKKSLAKTYEGLAKQGATIEANQRLKK